MKTKREVKSPPKELYTSPYFQKMQTYAEQTHDQWFILSAEHGLLDPDGPPIDPYELTLRDMSKSERQTWATRVFDQLREESILQSATLTFHAGKSYYQELLPLLEDSDVHVEIPTEGLMIGERLAWYNDRI